MQRKTNVLHINFTVFMTYAKSAAQKKVNHTRVTGYASMLCSTGYASTLSSIVRLDTLHMQAALHYSLLRTQ